MRDRRIIERARRLRRDATLAERVLWQKLRGHKLRGWSFRRQSDVGGYVVDFVCHELRLIIELDGPVHEEPEQAAFDGERDRKLMALGFAVLRLNERFVREAPEEAVLTIIGVARRVEAGLPPILDEVDDE